jgi:hypothetical protein
MGLVAKLNNPHLLQESNYLTNMESATIFGSVFSQTIKSQHCCSAFSLNSLIVHLNSLKKFRNMMHTLVPVIDSCLVVLSPPRLLILTLIVASTFFHEAWRRVAHTTKSRAH